MAIERAAATDNGPKCQHTEFGQSPSVWFPLNALCDYMGVVAGIPLSVRTTANRAHFPDRTGAQTKATAQTDAEQW
jgi:hypothetical protein